MPHHILCVGFPKWEGDYMKSTVQLLSELALYHEVLYVEYPFTWKDLWRGLERPGSAPAARILGIQERLREVELDNGGRVHVLTLPPFIPANWIGSARWYDRLTRWNGRLALPAIRRAMDRLGFGRPVVINAFQPAFGSFLRGRLNERLLLYYCYDEIAAAPWISRHGARTEAQFLPLADAVITSSRQLAAARQHQARQCFVIRNGVDDRLFRPTAAAAEPAVDRGRYSGVVGYLGSVDLRLDYDLLGEVIGRLPDKLFVFVGRINHQEGKGRLESFDNVRLLGPRPPAQLPAFVQAFDAGIIPFLDNELTSGIYPLKVNEYLAMGKPVVTTAFGDMEDFRGEARIARGAADFRQALLEELAADEPGRAIRRIDFARRNSWQQRAAELDELICSLLGSS